MKSLFYRHPLIVLAFLAGFFIYNNYIKQPTLNVSVNEKLWQICVSKNDEEKKHCFDLPKFFAKGKVSVDVQNREIFVQYSDNIASTIDTKWEFNTKSNKLFLKKFVGNFSDRNNRYVGSNICSIDDANIFIGDIYADRFVDSMTKCHYEYTKLPPLEEIVEDMVEMARNGLLYKYSTGEYINRYSGFLKKYPLSDANQVTYNNMGYYLEQVGAYEAAIYVLNAVLEKYPQRVVAHLNIANAYWDSGERVKARKHYEEYVRLMKDQKKDLSNIPQTVYDRLKPTPPFTDSRDGQQYRVVEIDKQTWMAENLNYKPSDGNSWCYKSSVDNCTKYGRLYDWKTALTVCPSGWHLPSRQEWNILGQTLGSEHDPYDETGIIEWDGADKKLKAKHGWDDYYGENGNGTDDYGFSALPGGRRESDSNFYHVGMFGYWWTATAVDIAKAYSKHLYNGGKYLGEERNSQSYGFSVRCVQN